MSHSIRSAKNVIFLSLGLAAPASPFAAPPSASNFHFYVAPEGSDSNMGSKKAPFRTIARAASLATPGTTIHVASGHYTGGFKTAVSGTAAGRIVFQSSDRGGARILAARDAPATIAWENRGNHVDIIGFEIDGSSAARWKHGIYDGGSHNSIRNNHVHHIGIRAPCSSAPAGIGVDSYYRGVQVDVIGNRVHDIGAIGCRNAKGVYLNTTGSVKNNVVYAIGGTAIELWHDARNVMVANNTVANAGSGIVVGGGDQYFSKGPNDGTSVVNNIVYDNKYGIAEQGATGLNNSYRNNLVFMNAAANWTLRNGLVHAGTVTAPPQFVRYVKSGTPDFHLLSTSPAIGAALAEHAHPVDIDGKARLKDGGFDIGAYQR